MYIYKCDLGYSYSIDGIEYGKNEKRNDGQWIIAIARVSHLQVYSNKHTDAIV